MNIFNRKQPQPPEEEDYFPYKMEKTPFVNDVYYAKKSLCKVLERLESLENKVHSHDEILHDLAWISKNWKTIAGSIVAMLSISVYVVERLPDIKLSGRKEVEETKVEDFSPEQIEKILEQLR